MKNNKPMLLVTAPFGDAGLKTFKLMPISSDCPFNEAVFNNDYNVLAVISKEKKTSHFMVEKLTEEGLPELNKKQTAYKKQRVTLDKYYEYYITEKQEIIDFVEMVAFNSDTFDYTAFFKKFEAAPQATAEAAAETASL
jgi:hypothetical protein